MSIMNIKCNFKQLMKEQNISMYRVQKKSNLSYKTLNKYRDDNVKQYDKEVLAKLCTILGCKIEELLILEDSKNESKY